MATSIVPLHSVVDAGYQHHDKVAEPAPDVASRPGLKWYEIRSPERQVDDGVRAQARSIIDWAWSGTSGRPGRPT